MTKKMSKTEWEEIQQFGEHIRRRLELLQGPAGKDQTLVKVFDAEHRAEEARINKILSKHGLPNWSQMVRTYEKMQHFKQVLGQAGMSADDVEKFTEKMVKDSEEGTRRIAQYVS